MIEHVERANRLLVRWTDGVTAAFPWRWVRDHSHDAASLHPATGQRLVAPSALDRAERPVAVRLTPSAVEVDWGDGTAASVLPLAFLDEHRADRPRRDRTAARTLWDGAEIARAEPSVTHRDVVGDDDGLRALLDTVHRFGCCIVRAVPPTVDGAEALLRRIGYVRETIFGGVWEFGADGAMADTAYTSLGIAPHTDGTYSHDAPGLQLLVCLELDGDGAVTTLVDGYRVAAELRAGEPELFGVLSSVPVPGRYVGDGADLRSSRPIVRIDDAGDVEQVSFNNADRAAFALAPDAMDRWYDALEAFDRLVADPRLAWHTTLTPGTGLLVDNWRVLHGRSAFTGQRRMCGGYVNREDFESKRRVLADGAAQPAGNVIGT